MENLGITWFDLVALAIVAFSGIMAFARGLIREIFSIVALIGAAVAAIYLAERVRPFIEQFTPLDGMLATLAAGLVVFLVVFFAILFLTSVVAKTAHESTEIGSFDRAAGLAFGILRGVVVVALFVLLLRQATGSPQISPQASMPEAIANARTYPIYESVAVAIEGVLPQVSERVRARAGDMMNRRESPTATTPIPAAPAATPAAQP